MTTSRFSEPQILAILRQAEGGVPVPELCREHGMSTASFYKWRAKYGGMNGSTNTSSKASRRHRNSPHNGYGPTTTNGPIWASAASHPHRN